MGHNTISGRFNVTIAEIQAISLKFKNIKVNANNVYVFTDEFISDIEYDNLMNLLNSKQITEKQEFSNAIDKTDFIAKKLGLK